MTTALNLNQKYLLDGCYSPPERVTLCHKVWNCFLTRSPNLSLNFKEFRSFFKAAIVKKNEPLTAEFRAELQQHMYNAYGSRDKLHPVVLNEHLGHLYCLIPYTYPEKNDTMQIPVQVNGKWASVTYKVDELIPLTKAIPSPLEACAMMPCDNDNAPPLLIFLGTTYPAGKGFLATLFADVIPGIPVGSIAYRMGEKKLKAWLEDKSDVHAYGVSLGGALAMHASRNHPGYFSQVNVFNPPGLYPWNRKHYPDKVEVNVFNQRFDVVSSMGLFPTGKNVNIYRIYSESVKCNIVKAHNYIYTGGKTVTVEKRAPEKVNRQINRVVWTVLRDLAGILACIPLMLILIPVFCAKHLYRFFKWLYHSIFSRSPKKIPENAAIA